MIRRQVVLPAPPELVWEALVDADRSEAWMGGRLTLSELVPGAPLEFREEDGTRREGEVSVVRPGRYLRFTWWPADEADAGPSSVSYLVEPAPDGATRLTVQELEVPTGSSASLWTVGTGWTDRDDTRFQSWARAVALARA